MKEYDDIGQQHKDNPPKCPLCGKVMYEVKDKIVGEYTGFNWRCNCMPKDTVLMLA